MHIFSGTKMNWTEVFFTSEPVAIGSNKRKIETKNINGQCPSSHPFAFNNGTKCCQTHLESRPSSWHPTEHQGLLHYNSQSCYEADISCPYSKCINENAQSYTCFGGNYVEPRTNPSPDSECFLFREMFWKKQDVPAVHH